MTVNFPIREGVCSLHGRKKTRQTVTRNMPNTIQYGKEREKKIHDKSNQPTKMSLEAYLVYSFPRVEQEVADAPVKASDR